MILLFIKVRKRRVCRDINSRSSHFEAGIASFLGTFWYGSRGVAVTLSEGEIVLYVGHDLKYMNLVMYNTHIDTPYA